MKKNKTNKKEREISLSKWIQARILYDLFQIRFIHFCS